MSEYIDEITAMIKRAETDAYERGLADGYDRGKKDAKQEILYLLTTASDHHKEDQIVVKSAEKVDEPQSRTVSDDRTTQINPIKKRIRAQRGLVPKFVARVLSEHRGLMPKEILEHAANDDERMIKAASIRSELNAGKDKGKYRSDDGKWFLSDEAEGRSLDGKPSASIFD